MGKAALILLAFLAGCAMRSEEPSPADPRQIWCDFNSPRRDATPDTPRAELDEINTHNAKGVAWCGWEP
ncbi:hypothetical protein [Chelativorans sp. AA-79]|uniref:hypothetical protein n=1 Tax=Chelativorans sp. AA-79 TaxID=3028735 RepID=UPI0023F672DB|nr:hypothetical protein [Chelativorans sp. AA-79]WEX07359.1 hypothetical protein PVE73_14635 [Chelativorans sp. AA-79]